MLSLKDKILYAKYKDTPLQSAKELRKKYVNVEGLNLSEIYAEISKYQVKKYGHMLCGKYFKWIPPENLDRMNRNIGLRKRRNYKRKNRKEITWTDMLGLEDEERNIR